MRPRSAVLTALLVSSIALAGCTTVQGAETPIVGTTTVRTTTTTASTTAATTPATVSYTDCPYHLSVDTAREEDISRVDETYAYRELPPERQREFEAALRNTSAELGSELPSTWERPRIVRYQGDRYYTVASVC